MGKYDNKTLIGQLSYNDRFLVSDQSQTDGSQDRNATPSIMAEGFEREVSETSHGLSVGDAVRFNGTNWVAATADTTANAELLGIVSTVIDTDTFAFKQTGSITTTGLTAGDYYYLQDAGGLGTTAGTVTVPIGLAVSTTVLWLTPFAADTGGAGSVSSMDDLSDADTTTASPSTGDLLEWDGSNWIPAAREQSFSFACSDETTDLTTGTAKVTYRMPYAFTVTAVRASVTTAPTGAALQVDINESGTSILSTELTIDASEKTSETAATPAVISDSSLANDAELTIDIDQVGSSVAGAGLKVTLIGRPT